MVKLIKTIVKSIEKLSEENFILQLVPEKPFSFSAGQFMMICVNGCERPFSIASHPSQKTLDFLIKEHEGGAVSPFLMKLKKGDTVSLSGPFGSFKVLETKAKEIVFIATGTGVAPFKSMVLDALLRFPEKKITLIFGFRFDFYFEKFWRRLEKKYKNFKIYACCSRADEIKWKGLSGRVTDHLGLLIKNSDSKEIYMCGSSEMVEFVREILIGKISFSAGQIHLERWDNAKNQTVAGKKLKIGWFSFSCCEDSTILFTELLNDHFAEWSKVIDFQHVRILRKNNKLEGLDVAFVEGAVATAADEKKVKEIRKNCKKLVAIGSCACTGMPSAQRNLFDPKRMEEIEFLLKRFHQAKKVKKLDEVVKVDAKVPGCPMDEAKFLEVLNGYLREFRVSGRKV